MSDTLDFKLANLKLFERLRFMRMAAGVERCHTKPHLLRYSIGHHTHDVLTLLILCWKAAHNDELPRAELLVAAHVHDHPELVTGDLPSPVKDLMEGRLDRVEETVETWLGLGHCLTAEEQAYLFAADRFELWLWRWEEMARGNSDLDTWCRWYVDQWRTNELPWPFMRLMELVLDNEGLPHLTPVELNHIGGLTVAGH